MKRTTFREACCGKFGLAKDHFEEAVLWQCVPGYHRVVGKLEWLVNRAYFEEDLELIRLVADCTTLAELHAGLSYFRSIHPPTGFRRKLLRARLSGRRLVNLANEVLPDN